MKDIYQYKINDINDIKLNIENHDKSLTFLPSQCQSFFDS